MQTARTMPGWVLSLRSPSADRVLSVDQCSATGAWAAAAGATTACAALATAFLRETFLGAAGAMDSMIDGVPVRGAYAQDISNTSIG